MAEGGICMKKAIIAIGRQYGSEGRKIGTKISS